MTDCGCNNFPAGLGNVTYWANVGIGTASPSERLHVAGNALIGGTYLSMDTSLRSLHVETGGGQDNYLHINAFGDHPGVKVNQNAARPFDVNGGQFHIASGGNVGIGTTTPGALLEVKGSGSGAVRIPNSGTFLGIGSNSDGYEMNMVGGIPDATNMGGQIRLGGNARGDNDINVIQFLQNGLEKMRINNGGNVGIGTPNPAQNLHVSSPGNTTMRLTNTAASANGEISVVQDKFGAGEHSLQIAFPVAEGASRSFDFRSNAADHMVIRGNGKVGIGTANPGEKLEVSGNIKASGSLYAGTRQVANANGCLYA